MNICLNDSRFLGCFPQCLDIDTGLLAQQAGIHSVIYYFLDGSSQATFTVGLIGDNIVIPNIFNEFGEAVFKILQPDGSFLIDGTDDTFKVNITPTF